MRGRPGNPANNEADHVHPLPGLVLWTEGRFPAKRFPIRSGELPCVITSSISVESIDREGEAAVEDFPLAHSTYEVAKRRRPKERIRLSQETSIVEDGSQR